MALSTESTVGWTTSDFVILNPNTPYERRVNIPFSACVTAANQEMNISGYFATAVIGNLEASNVQITKCTANEFSATNATLASAHIGHLVISTIDKPAAKNSTCAEKGILTYDIGSSAIYISVATNKWVRVAVASWS